MTPTAIINRLKIALILLVWGKIPYRKPFAELRHAVLARMLSNNLLWARYDPCFPRMKTPSLIGYALPKTGKGYPSHFVPSAAWLSACDRCRELLAKINTEAHVFDQADLHATLIEALKEWQQVNKVSSSLWNHYYIAPLNGWLRNIEHWLNAIQHFRRVVIK